MKTSLTTLLVLAAAVLAVPCSAQNLLQNGSFENSTTGWWPSSGSLAEVHDPTVQCADGTNAVGLGYYSTLSQGVPTVIGQRYRLSFYMADWFSGSIHSNLVSLYVGFGSNSFGPATFSGAGRTYENMGWQRVDCEVIAGSMYSSITFSNPAAFGTDALWPLIDKVSLTRIEEPPSGNLLVGWGWLPIPFYMTNVIGIAAGYENSLAINGDGTVSAWGTYRADDAYEGLLHVPVAVPAGLSNVVAVAGGTSHSLALQGDGTVVAWGTNQWGQVYVPAGLSNVVAIAASGNHSLALKADGTVVGWGSSPADASVPPGLSNVVAISAGSGYIALQDDGSVVVWGDWAWKDRTNVPPDMTNVVSVAGSAYSWLALKADGTVLDTVGEGTAALSGVTNVVAISGSSGNDGHINLALRADGTVLGWGVDVWTGPVPLGLSNVVAVAAGGWHNLALVGTAPPVLHVPLTNPALDTNGFSVSLPTRCGRVYRLEYCTSVTDSHWTPLPLVAGSGHFLRLTDPDPASGSRFYRVRQW